MEWWVFPALVLCAVTFTAAAGVLVFLAARGVWRLLAAYRREPAHAARLGETRAGVGWLPWEGDLRFGSMILAEEAGLQRRDGETTDAPDNRGPGWPVNGALDWREVAHEGDWRDQTRHDLAPAVLDSGPGGTSLAPGPDWLRGPEQPHEKPAGTESAGSGHLDEPEPEAGRTVAGRLVETSDEWLRRLVANAAPGWTYAGTVAA